MTVYVVDAHGHIQKLVSVVKMATVLEECNTKEQPSVVHYLRGKMDTMQMIFTKELFSV
jgi:hypothetical protein